MVPARSPFPKQFRWCVSTSWVVGTPFFCFISVLMYFSLGVICFAVLRERPRSRTSRTTTSAGLVSVRSIIAGPELLIIKTLRAQADIVQWLRLTLEWPSAWPEMDVLG